MAWKVRGTMLRAIDSALERYEGLAWRGNYTEKLAALVAVIKNNPRPHSGVRQRSAGRGVPGTRLAHPRRRQDPRDAGGLALAKPQLLRGPRLSRAEILARFRARRVTRPRDRSRPRAAALATSNRQQFRELSSDRGVYTLESGQAVQPPSRLHSLPVTAGSAMFGITDRRHFLTHVAGAAAVAGPGATFLTGLRAPGRRTQEEQEVPRRPLDGRRPPPRSTSGDMKPESSNGGLHKPKPTAASGIAITEHLPKVGAQFKNLSVIRSLMTSEGDHNRGTTLMSTGRVPQRPDRVPAHRLGAQLPVRARPRGDEADGPAVVHLGRRQPRRAGVFGDEVRRVQRAERGERPRERPPAVGSPGPHGPPQNPLRRARRRLRHQRRRRLRPGPPRRVRQSAATGNE